MQIIFPQNVTTAYGKYKHFTKNVSKKIFFQSDFVYLPTDFFLAMESILNIRFKIVIPIVHVYNCSYQCVCVYLF